MTAAIIPEVVGIDHTELLLDTDLTPTELARVTALELRLKTSDARILEQYIAQGETLFTIQQEKLYRSREPGERFTWAEYLQKFTPALTKNGKGYGIEAAQLRCLLHLFHSGKIPAGGAPGGSIPLPTCLDQLRPLLAKAPSRNASQGGGFDLNGDWLAVIEIWKGAITKDRNPDRTAVNAARLAYEASQLRSGGDPGRMLSQAQRDSLARAHASRSEAAATPSVPSAGTSQPKPQPVPDFSPRPQAQPAPARTIPAWELERTDDSALDPRDECRRVSRAISDAHKAIGVLRGILYSQINTYGSDYLTYLRQVDAGVYSLNNIDAQVEQMGEDIDFIASLLIADVVEGELARSTFDVDSMPTRG